MRVEYESLDSYDGVEFFNVDGRSSGAAGSSM